MAISRTVHTHLLRVLLITLVSLFAIPVATLFFTQHALRTEDAAFLQRVDARLLTDAKMSAEEKAEEARFYRGHLLSMACDATDPQDQNYHDQVCGDRTAMHWQFHRAERVARWTLLFGAALLASVLVLGGLAFANRGLRYASFVAGWRLMTLSSAAEVLLQGAMAVWLSFWVLAYFSHSYSPKLVIAVGLIALAAVFVMLKALFKKPVTDCSIDGELVAESDAPLLWERVRRLATQVRTAPPDQIVAGIDANFFVTEAPRFVGDHALTGRTLFVSLPLVRILETSEADTVLAHELAHLGGGDTRDGAKLGPMLRHLDEYTAEIRSGGLTTIANYLLRLYRMIFELALARDSREREFIADRTAASVTAPNAIVQSLIKIAAYANYRGQVERQLFAHDRQHDNSLGIAGFVADGLRPYAASMQFIESMKTADVPHPYDTHPPLVERMRNVGHEVAEGGYGSIVTAAPTVTWADDISTAADIEQRLWSAYESRFAAQHDRALAYRYEPATDEERAHVLRYFPPVAFALAKNQSVRVSYAGLESSTGDARLIPWDEVKGLTFKQGHFGALSLVVTHHERALLRARTTPIALRGIGKQKDALKGAIGDYWQRHQVMRTRQTD